MHQIDVHPFLTKIYTVLTKTTFPTQDQHPSYVYYPLHQKNLTTGPEISEGSIFLACSSPPLSVMDLVRLTEDDGRGGARDFLLPSFPRKLLRLVARGSSIFSAVTASLSSFLSSFGSDESKSQRLSKFKHLTKN